MNLSDLGDPPKTSLPLVVGGLAALVAGTFIPFFFMEEKEMPPSMKRIFRTGVQWLEPRQAAVIVSAVLFFGGTAAIMYGATPGVTKATQPQQP